MKKQPVLFQGIEGAYSEEALFDYIQQNNLDFVPKPQPGFFREFFDGIETDTGMGWVPIENSYFGTVTQSVDLLREFNFEVIGSHRFAVNHCLCAKSGTKIDEIEKVYSHPQALGQCSKFLFDNKLSPAHYEDTAAAAKYVAASEEKGIAVICSKRAAQIYGLDILEENIQDASANTTRFLLVKKKGLETSGSADLKEKQDSPVSVIMFETKDIPSALYKCLGVFAEKEINLLKIDSRPSHNEGGDVFFYTEFEGAPTDETVKSAVTNLGEYANAIVFLGSY